MKYPLLLAVLFSCIGMAPARQTPPSPSDTVQRATAALQTDNASICTPHATGAETPPTLHPDTAQPSARTQFIRPPYLRPGDTVGIVTPARKLSEKADTAKVRERFESWGLKVKFGPHTADREQPYFAGTDAQRAADLQAMIDDPGVKAVVSFQGGYGSVRLLPLIDLSRLREHPKWVVGFSDVTMLHLALGRLGVESLHATMPGKFRFGSEETADAIVSDEALRSALLGLRQRIDTGPHPLNCPGTARGRLTGGNLAIVCSSLGTPEEPDFDAPHGALHRGGRRTHVPPRPHDAATRPERKARQMQSHPRRAFFRHDRTKHFGITDPYDIVAQYVRPLGIPVVFGLPTGHEDPNVALYMGREVTVTVGETGAVIEF